MDALNKLRGIMKERNISEYKLAKMSNIPQSTINTMFNKYNNPSIYTLEAICKALGMTMSEFFYEEFSCKKDVYAEKHLLRDWAKLNRKQKDAIALFIELMTDKN